jgi:hypothetical protein
MRSNDERAAGRADNHNGCNLNLHLNFLIYLQSPPNRGGNNLNDSRQKFTVCSVLVVARAAQQNMGRIAGTEFSRFRKNGSHQ